MTRVFRLMRWMVGMVVLISGGEGAVSAAGEAAKPNFVVINIDDLGYADIGPFGGKAGPTPHLDRMAAEGRKLTSFYAAPVCSPSRASLMTGCYPKRVLPIPHVLFPASKVGLHPEEQTIAEVLKQAGYATGCVGKWHLGDQPGMLPNDQGFDYYYGLPYSNDMGLAEDGAKSNPGNEGRPGAAKPQAKTNSKPKAGAKGKAKAVSPPTRPAGVGVADGSPPEEDTGLRGAAQPPLPLLENGKVIERVRAAEQTTLTQRYTEKAVAFIEKHREQPFFLYLPHSAVHFPLYPGMKWRGKSGQGLLADWVGEVDWSVGQVLETLRQAGLAERTLVLFTSDNGGSLVHGSDNGPLRGAKGSTLEGGMRVCTLAWWPGKIPGGTATDAIAGMLDVLPTLAARAGLALDQRTRDGVDLWPALSGDGEPRREFLYFRGPVLEAVRQGPWKLHLKKGELYELEQDIGEARDLAGVQPEVVARLKRLADSIEGDLGTTVFGPGCRPLGRVEKALPLIGADGAVRAGFAP